MERKYETPELIKIMKIYRGGKISLQQLKTKTWSMVLKEDRGRLGAIDCRGSSNWLLLLGSEVFFVGVKKKNLAQRLLEILENGDLEEYADGDLEEQPVDEGHLEEEYADGDLEEQSVDEGHLLDVAGPSSRSKGGKKNPMQWLEEMVCKRVNGKKVILGQMPWNTP